MFFNITSEGIMSGYYYYFIFIFFWVIFCSFIIKYLKLMKMELLIFVNKPLTYKVGLDAEVLPDGIVILGGDGSWPRPGLPVPQDHLDGVIRKLPEHLPRRFMLLGG